MGEGSDGERTHRCHRRCGLRGELPRSRCSWALWLGTSPWTRRARGNGGCGRRMTITSAWPQSTASPQVVLRADVGNIGCCRARSRVDDASPWARGVRRGLLGDNLAASCRSLWTTSGVLHEMSALTGTHKTVHRLWICGRRRAKGVHTGSCGPGHDSGQGDAQVGRSLWTSADTGRYPSIAPRQERDIEQDRRQPARCLMRLVSSVTWL